LKHSLDNITSYDMVMKNKREVYHETQGGGVTKDQLRELVNGLIEDDLRTLRAIINGMLSKRKITPDQQAKMQEARKKKVI